jgi:fumarate reductase (CoM/CoB) subunit B
MSSTKSNGSSKGKDGNTSERKKATIADCSNCGFCKAVCPVFLILLEETKGARGRAALAKRDIKDEVYYLCSLCGACRVACPEGIDLPEEIRKMREKMIDLGLETEGNKKMVENVRQFGNPFGKVEKGKTPKDLYCC